MELVGHCLKPRAAERRCRFAPSRSAKIGTINGVFMSRPHQKAALADLAVAAMRERGSATEFSREAPGQLAALDEPAENGGEDVVDLTGLPWRLIDNGDSRDLGQMTVSQPLAYPDQRQRGAGFIDFEQTG
jgi:hypothetical protein